MVTGACIRFVVGSTGSIAAVLQYRFFSFYLLQYSLGKAIERPVVVDVELARDLQACAEASDHFSTILGKTLCADDFYEGKAARKKSFS